MSNSLNVQSSLAALIRLRLHRSHSSFRRMQSSWQSFRRHPLGILGVALIILFAIMAIVHPILLSSVWPSGVFDPITGFDSRQMPHPNGPNARHWLGTDNFGRDVLSQLLAGAQISFRVGILAAIIAVTISTLMGGAAGYFGNFVDTILMGVADVFVLLPAPVVLLIFGLLLRMQWFMVAVLFGILTGLGAQSIVVKSHTITLRHRQFIEAAKIAGGSQTHIFRKHILPGLLPITIVHAVLTVVGAVLTESLLAFFGRTQHYLSWGSMIWMGQETFRWFTLSGQWHAILPPALSIMAFCSAFYFVGRALDETFNPRLRQK